jgi:hypothetical protein
VFSEFASRAISRVPTAKIRAASTARSHTTDATPFRRRSFPAADLIGAWLTLPRACSVDAGASELPDALVVIDALSPNVEADSAVEALLAAVSDGYSASLLEVLSATKGAPFSTESMPDCWLDGLAVAAKEAIR